MERVVNVDSVLVVDTVSIGARQGPCRDPAWAPVGPRQGPAWTPRGSLLDPLGPGTAPLRCTSRASARQICHPGGQGAGRPLTGNSRLQLLADRREAHRPLAVSVGRCRHPSPTRSC